MGRYRNTSVSGQTNGIHSRVQVWQRHSCFPSCYISFPVDNWTLHPLLLHSFVFLLLISIRYSPEALPPTYPCSAEHSSSPLMWFLNRIGKTPNPGLGCPSRKAVLFPHPWAYPLMCMFWYLQRCIFKGFSSPSP